MDNNWNTYNQDQTNPYQPNNNQVYQPYQPGVQEPVKEEPVKLSEYLLILMLCAFIPCAGIVLLFVFGFGKDEKQSKKNFCRAYLITMGVGLALALIWVVVYVAIIAAMLG